MFFHRWFVLACALVLLPTPCLAEPPALTSAQMQADFDLLRHALEEAHPGLYRYSTKAQMDREFDVQRGKLLRPMPREQFEVVVAQTLASIRCGHTTMAWDPELKAAFRDGPSFPLRLAFEGSRLMVVLNQTADDRTIRPGMELVSVNGHPVAELVKQFWAVTYADGDIETSRRRGVANDFAKDYFWLVGRPEYFTVTAIDPSSGKAVQSKLAGVTEAQRKANHNPVNEVMLAGLAKVRGETYEKLSLSFLKQPDVALVRIPLFMGDEYPRFIEATFRALREKRTKTLIIDLRSNGGGEDTYGVMLVSHLTDKPFHYGDKVIVKTMTWSFAEHWDAKPLSAEQRAHIRKCLTPNPDGGYFVSEELHNSLGEKQPAKDRFLGDVIVLIDGATFSTAADTCAVIHHLKRATFIGEETAGAYYGNNSGTEPIVTLPNSKVQFGLPLCSGWNAVSGYAGKRRGTIPDHVVVTKTADLLRGVDAQLQLALKLAVLNRLRDEINAHYGCDKNGDPYVNCGPCGRFARAFREQWNARFNEKVHIVFCMSPDGSHCGHVLVKFPDGSYFDGGRGVMSEQKMRTFNPGARLDEMVEFDPNLLDKRCDYLLNRRCDGRDFVYPGCPRYRDDLTAQLIKKHLEMLRGVD